MKCANILTIIGIAGLGILLATPTLYAIEGANVDSSPIGIDNLPTRQPLKVAEAEVANVATEEITGLDYLIEIEEELKEITEQKAPVEEVAIDLQYSLDDCLGIALERHLPIRIAKDKVNLARRKLIKAIRDLFPNVSLTYEHDLGFKLIKADVNGDDSSQQFRSEKWRASLSQPIFRGGALWNKVQEERANLRAAKAEYNKVFFDLSVEVAKAFFNLSKARTLLSFKEQIFVIAGDSLSLSEEKLNTGLISEIEHLNVQSLQGQLEHDLEEAKENIALALIDLQKVLNVKVTDPIDVTLLDTKYTALVKKDLDSLADTAESMTEDEKQKELDKLVKLAYDNRSEFVIQKSKVDAASYAEKAAVAGWMPQVDISLERGQKAEAYLHDDNNPPWDEEQRIAFQVSMNILGSSLRYIYDKNRQGTGVEAVEPLAGIGLDGYYDRKNIISLSILDDLKQFVETREARVKRKEAFLELELSEKDIVSEVKESFYNYHRALIQLKSVFKRILYRQKLVDLAKHRSEINEIQLSEYIQAEIDLVNEKDALYKAMVDYFLAKVSLSKSIGIQDYFPIEITE